MAERTAPIAAPAATGPAAPVVNASPVSVKVSKVARRRRDFANEELFAESGADRLLHLSLLAMAASVVIFIVWAALAQIDETAVTFGEVVPSQAIQQIQHLEGGIVAELMVREGDLVEAGQPLVRFDSAATLAERDQMRQRAAALELQAERLAAFADGRMPDFSRFALDFASFAGDQQRLFEAAIEARANQRAVLRQQIAERQSDLTGLEREIRTAAQSVDLLEQEVRIRKELVGRELNSKLVLLGTQRQLAMAQGDLARLEASASGTREAMTQLQSRITELDGRLRQEALDKLGTVRAELAEVQEVRNGLDDRLRRLVVSVPVRGVVQSLPLKNVGAVLPPGGVVAEIVPVDDTLIVETRISTRDIGFVSLGQPVNVKVHTFDFSRFGSISGRLHSLSATTFVDEQKTPYYRATAVLEKNFVGLDPTRHFVLPGMTVQVDINTGRKTLIQYLLKPIYVGLEGAFRER